MIRLRPRLPSTDVGRLRLAVIVATAVATVLKLYLAMKSTGTDDVWLFQLFANRVREHGPVGVYGDTTSTITPPHQVAINAPYNHPPLIGWMLLVFNFLVDHGFRFFALIRLPAIVSDFVTAVLLFELIRLRRPVREAAVGAALFAWSPALGVISGFHGNTDPVCIMFTVLALYLLVVRNAPALAGISYAVGLSVKLVVIVVGPLLLYIAWRDHGRRLFAFLGAGGAVLALLWGPPLATHFAIVRRDVIGYAGYGPRQWGLPQFATWLGVPSGWIDLYAGPGRFLVLALSAGVPVLLARRRPDLTLPAAGLSLAVFLLITPAHAMQYTVWPIAGMYLMNVWAASVYSLAGGLLLLKVYSRWSQAPPWHWHQAWSTGMNHDERHYGALVWLVLLVTTVVSLLPRFTRAVTGVRGSGGATRSANGNDRRAPAAWTAPEDVLAGTIPSSDSRPG